MRTRTQSGGIARKGRIALMAGLGLCLAQAVWAETLGYREANRILPDGDSTVARIVAVPFLDDTQREILGGLRMTIPFYGSLALSPDEGLFVDWLQASGQHHSVDAARAAAMAHCEASRKKSSASCVIVLDVVPKGWDAEAPVSLSQSAAEALRGPYRKLRGDKAFAISAQTGTFGFGASSDDAITACAEAGAEDCQVIIAD